jgi:hypothetical protein
MGSGCGWALAAVFAVPLVISFGLNQYTRGGGPSAPDTRNTTIAKVNGDSITGSQFNQLWAQMSQGNTPSPGPQFAQAQGAVLYQLINQTLLTQEAQRRGLRVSDSEIDALIAKQKGQTSDADWESHLEQMGTTSDEFRDFVAHALLPSAVLTSTQSQIKVTEDDARNQYNEVNLDLVSIPAASGPQSPLLKNGQKPLSDAEARKKAEDLLAKVRAGADIAVIAKANPGGIFTQKGGVTGWQQEFPDPQRGMSLLSGVYGKDFLDAVHKTAKGQLTDVISMTGFMKGYVFAKVLDRRSNVPKDFNAQQAVTQLKEQKAKEIVQQMVSDLFKRAKIEITDPDKRAFYDFFRLQMPTLSGGMPTAAEHDTQQAQVTQEFEEYLKRHPDDDTAAAILADTLQSKMYASKPGEKVSPEQTAQIRDRLISLYQIVLNQTEDRETRFKLAELYRDKKQNDLAIQQYDKIKKYLNDAPPDADDLQGLQSAQEVHKRLAAGFKSVDQMTEATQEDAQTKTLDAQIKTAQKKAAQAPPSPSSPITLPSGGQATLPTSAPDSVPASAPPAGAAQPVAPSGAAPQSSAPPIGSAPPASSTPVPLKPGGPPTGKPGQ